MPLIVITGLPCSGKTKRAEQLRQALSKKYSKPIHVLNDESLNIDKEVYGDGREEKKARGALLSAVERHASKDAITIVDAMNYIKGFRYQLYCITRGLADLQVTMHIGTPESVASEWNEQTNRYTDKTFRELIMRYEEPNEMNRWDAPLFTVLYDDEEPPSENIYEALTNRKAKPPNMSTVSKPISEGNYLYQLDTTTQEVVTAIQSSMQLGISTVKVAGTSWTLPPNKTPSIGQLQRLRRQFTAMNKINTIQDMQAVRETFLQYLGVML